MKEVDLQKPHKVSITINLQDLFDPNKPLGRVAFPESQEAEKMAQLHGGISVKISFLLGSMRPCLNSHVLDSHW